MHKLMTILAAVLMTVSAMAAPKHYELKSPDGNLVVSIEAGDGISYSLTHGQDLLLDKANISMITVEGDVFGGVQPVKKVTRRSVSETITPVIYTKDVVKDEFNELTLKFKQFSVVFRAYDEGMAYRFISHLKGDYHVEYEMAEFNFAQDWNMWAAYVASTQKRLKASSITRSRTDIHTLRFRSGIQPAWHSFRCWSTARTERRSRSPRLTF